MPRLFFLGAVLRLVWLQRRAGPPGWRYGCLVSGSRPGDRTRPKTAGRAAGAGAMASALIAVLASTAAAAGKPPRAHPAGKGKEAASVTFECADALEDGTLVDERQGEALARLAVKARWLAGDPPPADARPRAVRLFCGPDLDGNGDREALAELTFAGEGSEDEGMSVAGDGSGTTYSLLVSKHGPTWRAVAGVAVDPAGGPGAGRGAVFVRRPGGRWGVEARRSGGGSEHDCRIAGYEIFELQGNELRSVKAGDRSVTCLPCGCDNP